MATEQAATTRMKARAKHSVHAGPRAPLLRSEAPLWKLYLLIKRGLIKRGIATLRGRGGRR